MSPTGDQARNPATGPDQESNRRPFGAWDRDRPAEPRRPGHIRPLELLFQPRVRGCVVHAAVMRLKPGPQVTGRPSVSRSPSHRRCGHKTFHVTGFICLDEKLKQENRILIQSNPYRKHIFTNSRCFLSMYVSLKVFFLVNKRVNTYLLFNQMHLKL